MASMQKMALVQKVLPPQMLTRLSGCFVLVFCCFGLRSLGQNAPVFEASIDARNVTLGSRFEIVFRLRNAEGKSFHPPRMVDGVRVVGGPSEEQSMGFVNGKTFTQQAWRYELEALKTGTLTIEPATVLLKNGQTLRTQPLSVNVSNARNLPEAALGARGNENVFVAGEIFPSTLYLGQQATWQIKLYTLVGVDGADLVELPDFKGFYAKEKRRFDTRLQYVTIKGRKYATKTLYEEALFPQEAGELNIGSAKIQVGLEQPGAFGNFLGAKPTVLETKPVLVKVLPLPQPVPAVFSGGVGRYEWAIQTDKDTLSTDDALTVTVSLKGNGDARRFAPPVFSMPAGLEIFDPKVLTEEEYDNGEEIRHEQSLEYAILPKKPGTYTFYPGLTYFDTDSNRYVTLQGNTPIQIRVGQGKNKLSTPTDFTPEGNKATGFKALIANPFFWLALALPVLLLLFWRRRPQPQPANQSPTPSLSVDVAKTTLPAAAPAPRKSNSDYFKEARQLAEGYPARNFYDALLRGQQAYFENQFGLTPTQFNVPNIVQAMRARGVDSDTIQNMVELWQKCEAAVYGGLSFSEPSQNVLQNAEALIAALNKRL